MCLFLVKCDACLNLNVCSQAFAVIAASPLRIDMSCVLEHVISELTAFLRKVGNYCVVSNDYYVLAYTRFFLLFAVNLIYVHVISFVHFFCEKQANRALRQATLGTLNSLIAAYGDKIAPSAYEIIIVELSTLIRF